MQDDGATGTDVAGVPAVDRLLSDPHDFAGLYIRHRGSFTLHARRYLRDARDADEVVQEAFLRLFLALPELETELQALAYCRRTITNLCIDRFRAQARRPSLVDLDSAGAMDLAEDDPGDPVVRAEDAAMVRAALSLLSPLHRAALVKREIEEKPLPVIAQELEIPEESVKHVLFRARRALRRILAGTSLAPGNDAEIAGALGRAVRSGSGGVAAFLMLLVLGLGTGPDLRAVPVVGTDLPELIPVTDIVSAVGGAAVVVGGAVGQAVTVVADEVAGVVSAGGDLSEPDAALDGAAADPPAVAAAPSPSPTTSAEANARATASPSAQPSALPSAASSPSASPLPTPLVTPAPPSTTPTPLPPEEPEEPSPKPSRSSSAPSPGSSAGPSSSPAPAASQGTSTGGGSTGTASEPRKSKKSPSPSPSPTPKPSPKPDADSYQTPGLEYAYDPDTGEMVLVPIGQTAETWRD